MAWPASPATGDTYTTVSGTKYTRTSYGTWKAVAYPVSSGGGATPVASTAQAVAGIADDVAMSPLKSRQQHKAIGFGVDQTWQDVTALRVPNTAYQNTSARPIEVSISFWTTDSDNIDQSDILISPDNTAWTTIKTAGERWTNHQFSFTVPPGYYYKLVGAYYYSAGTARKWSELK